MLVWLRSKEGSAKYLVNKQVFSVGRKDCDIIIENDQSISRKHATLTISEDDVKLRDCDSKYGTFLDGVQLQSNIEVPVKNGSEVKFGGLNSIFILAKLKIIVTTSNLKKTDKKVIANSIAALTGQMVDVWKPECTFLTVKEIMLTPKVLTSIISGIPIVTPSYWKDFMKHMNENRVPPDSKHYQPPIGEPILTQKSVMLNYNPQRKELFRYKIFIFSNKNIYNQMKNLIEAAGGKSILFTAGSVTVSTIKTSDEEYLIMNDVDSLEENSDMKSLLDYVRSKGQRPIPLQEIAMAIISCSCEKDCNPKFNRAAVLVENKENQNLTCGDALVLNTQTQPTQADIKEEPVVVPQSYDNGPSFPLPSTSFDQTGGVKREGEILNRADILQKVSKKEEGGDVHQKIVRDNPFMQLRQSTSTQSTINITSTSSQQENPFKKKRKITAVDDDKPNTTITNFAREASTSSNAFKNLFKRPKSEAVSEQKQKSSKNSDTNAQNSGRNNILSSTAMSHNDSGISFGSLDISSIKHDKVRNGEQWISITNREPKRNSSCDKTTVSKYLDDDMMDFINSFKNTSIVKVKNLLAPYNSTSSSIPSAVANGIKNFKKFKKNPLVRHQTTIIPKNQFIKVAVVGGNKVIEISDDDDDGDNEVQELKPKAAAQTTKKRFVFNR